MATCCLLRQLLLLLFLLRFSVADNTTTTVSEADALLLLKSSFNNTGALASWTNASTPCDPDDRWKGIICYGGIVTSLRLGGMHLSGKIDVSALSHLRGLRSASFVRNLFSGEIPNFGQLQALKAIYLSHNHFDGPIPDNLFSGMTHLKKLWLSGNAFSGEIPSSIANLKNLLELHLENNRFAGEIPDVRLPLLRSFNASNNRLNGIIPSGFAVFNASSFRGNLNLCGPPLDNDCLTIGESGEPETAFAPTATTKEIKSGKTAVVAAVLLCVLLALIAVGIIVKRKKEGGFDTLGVMGDEVEAGGVPGSSHGKRGSSYGKRGSGHGRRPESGKKTSVKGGMADLVIVSEEKGSFGLADLMKAAAEVLGNGSLGSAYKAVMASGTAVVVKRMREMNRLTKDVFDIEIRKLAGLRHPNVLSPIGYHYRKEEKLLVLDYIEKGSLLFLLHGDRGPYHAALDWPTRLKIATGLARGMAFLHEELATVEVPHGNLKSSNILLGREFEPLLVDFGYIPFINPLQTPNALFAYKSPEFVHYRHVSPKSDVFCLGVVILELLTGKFPSQYLNSGKGGTDVVQWAAAVVSEGKESDLLDPELVGSADPTGVERLVRLAADLVDSNPENRPEMVEVVRRVEEIAVGVGPVPTLKDGMSPNDGDRPGRRGDANFDSAIS